MADLPLLLRLWKIGVFLLLAGLIAFSQLLPLTRQAGDLPGPDLMILLALAWVMRRPKLVPMWIFLIVFLFADILFMRPLGLHTALVLVALDIARRRALAAPRMPFLREWTIVATAVAAITLAEVVIQTVLFVPQVSLGLALIRLMFTALAYPVVVLLMAGPFGLSRPKSNDKDLIIGHTT